jgi:hypothetical protein
MKRPLQNGMLVLLSVLMAAGSGVWLARPAALPGNARPQDPGILALHSTQMERRSLPVDPGVTSTLVQQARRFAQYLNTPSPARSAEPNALSRATVKSQMQAPATRPQQRPPITAPRFQVEAICCYRSHPEKSMALIAEPGAEPRWVKCRDKLGRLTIEAIHKQYVVWCDGERTGRAAIGPDPGSGFPVVTPGDRPVNPPVLPGKPCKQYRQQIPFSPRIRSKTVTRDWSPGP